MRISVTFSLCIISAISPCIRFCALHIFALVHGDLFSLERFTLLNVGNEERRSRARRVCSLRVRKCFFAMGSMFPAFAASSLSALHLWIAPPRGRPVDLSTAAATATATATAMASILGPVLVLDYY